MAVVQPDDTTMQTSIAIATAAIAAGGVAFAVSSWSASTAEDTPALLAGVHSSLQEIRAQQDVTGEQLRDLAERVDDLEGAAGGGSARAVPAAASTAAIAQIVREQLAALGASPPAGGDPTGAGADLATELFDALSADPSGREAQGLWKRAADAGLVDDLVRRFEERAEGMPQHPQAQVDLGAAYLQKLFVAGTSGPEAGTWANRADGAFDRALELEPTHWQARFSKATALSFWPPIFGKGPEAARQFETLIEQQQASGVREPRHAQTYLFLGNLYDQQGEKERALETWRQGFALHPESAALRAKIE